LQNFKKIAEILEEVQKIAEFLKNCRSSGNNPFIAKEVRGSIIFHEIQKSYLS
jgi:hypothetical protein